MPIRFNTSVAIGTLTPGTEWITPSDDSSTPLLFFGIPLNEDGTKKNKGVASPNNFPFKLRKVRSAVSDVKLIGISLLVM